MVIDIDRAVIAEYLDNALINSNNDWGEGYWIGRAVQHAHQNAVDHDWLVGAFTNRGLDAAIVAEPKPGDPDVLAN